MGVYLIGVHLMGVYLIGVYLMGVHASLITEGINSRSCLWVQSACRSCLPRSNPHKYCGHATKYEDCQQKTALPTNVHTEKTEQYFLIANASISQFASSTSFARDFWPRECAGVDAEFFRLRPRRPASAASFSSRFFRASVMFSKLNNFRLSNHG